MEVERDIWRADGAVKSEKVEYRIMDMDIEGWVENRKLLFPAPAVMTRSHYLYHILR
jgi:hypothetical protein